MNYSEREMEAGDRLQDELRDTALEKEIATKRGVKEFEEPFPFEDWD